MEYAKFRPLLAPLGRDIQESFARLAQQLSDFEAPLKMRITVRDCDKRTTGGLKVSKSGCSVTKGADKSNDIEVVVRAEEWWAICQGSLSPLEAVGKGALRFRGDPDLAVRLLEHLSGHQGLADPCNQEANRC